MDGNTLKKPWDILRRAKDLLSSRYFPFITAAVVIACYYAGLDLVTIYFLGAVSVLMLLLLDDLTPLVSVMLFLHVIISMKNTPTDGLEMDTSTFFLQPWVLAQVITVVALYVLAIVLRMAFIFKQKTFKFTPVFGGLCVFGISLVFNGAFTQEYTFNNLLYGSILAFVFLSVFVVISGSVKTSEENYLKLCWGFFAFSLLLVIELVAKYIANGPAMFDADGHIIKEMVVFGWGVWNTMGMLIAISIPPVVYLGSRYKHGYLFLLYATLLVAASFATTSRQSMICSSAVYIVSVIFAVIKGKNRKGNLVCLVCIGLAGLAALIIKYEAILKVLGGIYDKLFNELGQFDGNGRVGLIKRALNYFINAPLCGRGFHINFVEDPGFIGLNGFVPKMAHNTFAELLATCGIFGFMAYLLHRFQTVIAFFGHITAQKIFLGLSVAAMLLASLLDNHIFYIFPTIIYSALLPFALGESTQSKAVVYSRMLSGAELRGSAA